MIRSLLSDTGSWEHLLGVLEPFVFEKDGARTLNINPDLHSVPRNIVLKFKLDRSNRTQVIVKTYIVSTDGDTKQI